jgi:hypothetical protein
MKLCRQTSQYGIPLMTRRHVNHGECSFLGHQVVALPVLLEMQKNNGQLPGMEGDSEDE